MADLDVPFAGSALRREPNVSELATGFPCGPADQQLFNWLMWMVYSELGGVITGANALTASNGDMKQVFRSIRSGRINWAASGGTATAWTLDFSPDDLEAYYQGMLISTTVPVTSTGPVTAAADALASRPVRYGDGAEIGSGQLLAGQPILLFVDTAQFVVVGPFSAPSITSIVNNLAEKQPIYPEVLGTGVMSFTPTTGQIVVATGQQWQHRGLVSYNSTSFTAPNRTFATAANKVYHLVWDAPGTGLATPKASFPIGKFSLLDFTGASPSEADPTRDSTFDRMLCCVIQTNGSNVLTVTALKNKHELYHRVTRATSASTFGDRASVPKITATLNWARTPKTQLVAYDADIGASTESIVATRVITENRYNVEYEATGYINGSTYVAGEAKVDWRA